MTRHIATPCWSWKGPQECGKSAALKILAGPWFDEYLEDPGSKDGSMLVSGKWIVELAGFCDRSPSEIGLRRATVPHRTTTPLKGVFKKPRGV